jgi:hypothetical protein
VGDFHRPCGVQSQGGGRFQLFEKEYFIERFDPFSGQGRQLPVVPNVYHRLLALQEMQHQFHGRGSREPLSPIGTMLAILEHSGKLSHTKNKTFYKKRCGLF